MLFLKEHQKKLSKQNSQAGGSTPQVVNSMANRMVPTPYLYLSRM